MGLSAAAIAIVLWTSLGSPLGDLESVLRPEFEDVVAIAPDAESMFQEMRRPQNGKRGIEAAVRFIALPELPRAFRAYALARKAQLEMIHDYPNQAVATLRQFVAEFADIPEVAVLADLEIGRFMVDSGRAYPDFASAITHIQEQYERVFETYSPYQWHVVEGHLKFATACSTAAQEPLYHEFAYIGAHHLERALDIVHAVNADPSLLADSGSLPRFRNAAAFIPDRLAKERERARMIMESIADPYMEDRYGGWNGITAPADNSRAGLRAFIEQEEYIDENRARPYALHCDWMALAALGEYFEPQADLIHQTNAVHVAVLIPNGHVVTFAADYVFNQHEPRPALARAVVQNVDFARFIERMYYFAGREEWFHGAYQSAGVSAIVTNLSWEAPPRAQRNAAYLARAFRFDAVEAQLMLYLQSMRGTLDSETGLTVSYAFHSLGQMGGEQGLGLLAAMADPTYWDETEPPTYEPYLQEIDAVARSVMRWQRWALRGLQSSSHSTAKTHIDRLRRLYGPELLGDE